MYNGIENLRGPNEKLEYTQAMVDEYRKCANSYEYFVENYIKIDDNSGSLVIIDLYDYQKNLLKLIHDNKFVICKFPRQPLSLDTDIFTPNGWKKFGDIKRGDYLYDRNGKKTKVLTETAVMHENKCYKITFDNGQTIIADAEHLWTVSHSDWDHKEKVLTTQQIFEYNTKKKAQQNGSSVYVNMQSSLEFEEQSTPIHPYVLGLWLGDGHSDSGRITSHIEDFSHYLSKLNMLNYSISCAKEYRKNVITFQIEGLTKALRELGVKGDKHIPDSYIMTSTSQRIQLLKGLMDSDGNHKKSGACEFYQKSVRLTQDFRFLLSSLGIKSRVREKTIKGQVYYTISFRPPHSPFSLPRKSEGFGLVPSHPKNNRIYFSVIEETDSVPVKCIEVDNPESLFLVGETLVPSHNCGKTTSLACYIVWCIVFQKRFKVGVAADKDDTALEIIDRIKTAFEHLPYWMQQGVKKWDAHKVVLENGSRVDAAATTKKTFRGKTYNLVLLDEFAFVDQNIADPFFTAIYPTVSKGERTKLVIISTPNGMNHYYKLWVEAAEGESEFKHIEIKWDDVPGRDDSFMKKTIKTIGEDKWEQEYAGSFLGASTSLIPPWKLKQIPFKKPIEKWDNDMKFWKGPKKDHVYFITVDVCRGRGLDYHAMSVVDITTLPYEVVATFRDNMMDAMLFPALILQIAKKYNEAFVLVELNDNGEQVANILAYELEYENMLSSLQKGRAGQVLTVESGNAMGLTQSRVTKTIGCSNLKSLIMHDKLVLNDFNIIQELTTFEIASGQYKAANGSHDDMVMTLVTFAWASTQPYFADLMDANIRDQIFAKRMEQMEEELIPFGFLPDYDEDEVTDF